MGPRMEVNVADIVVRTVASVAVAVCVLTLRVESARSAGWFVGHLRGTGYAATLRADARVDPAPWIKDVFVRASVTGPQNDLSLQNTGPAIPHLVLWLESFGTWQPRAVVSFVRVDGRTWRTLPRRLSAAGQFVYAAPWNKSFHFGVLQKHYVWDIGGIPKRGRAFVAIRIHPAHSCCWYFTAFGFGDTDRLGHPDLRASIVGARAVAAFPR
jgi:hypothetical protein